MADVKLPPLPPPIVPCGYGISTWDKFNKYQMEAYARAAIAANAPAVPDAQDAANLLSRLERQWHRMGELWERCQGKGWPEKEGAEFNSLRDEKAPATRAALLAMLAASPQPQPVQPSEPINHRLTEALKRANNQAEHFEREWYLRGDEIEAALPAMREYARKNPKHHFSTDGTEQDPNGAHSWLDRNDKPSTEVAQAKPEQADHPEQDLEMVAQPERVPLTETQKNAMWVCVRRSLGGGEPEDYYMQGIADAESEHNITKKE